jgi:myo-inositol-1-phosphate synthase
MTKKKFTIQSPQGKLAVLLPGLGAVSTTFIAGVLAVLKGMAKPIGSLTQMGTIRLGKRTENRVPRIQDFVPLAGLGDLSFAAWDIFEDDAFQSSINAGVLERTQLEQLRAELESIRPMKAVFDPDYVKRLNGTYVKKGKTKMDLAEQLMEDIAQAKKNAGAERAVMIWCASTESYIAPGPVHKDLDAFERGLKENAPEIPPSMIYAYAAIKSGVGFANGAPNLTVDAPALSTLAYEKGVPIAGKDFKTGQTLMKTIIAPGLKARMLGLSGWFSSNILGNRDGEVLDDPGSFRTKEESKLSVVGTTSTSSAGWDIRCRSKWIFSAATRSWRRHSCSTWHCLWISPSVASSRGFRSGCRSISRVPCRLKVSTRSTTSSSNKPSSRTRCAI